MDGSALALVIVGGLISLIGGLILYNLQSLKKHISDFSKRIEDNETKVEQLKEEFVQCQVDCNRNNVSKEDWVRSEGYTRLKIEQMMNVLLELKGQIKIIEQMPAIVAQVTREIVKELKKE